MARYDALPAPLRQWLARAALPWSPESALRLWRRALAEQAATDKALDRLARAEAAALARDAAAIWGGSYPAAGARDRGVSPPPR
ncbi:MAG: hypothetical protein JJU40_13945 [Rhodobacteraceae bacterium]|nr:hypothetical protein [Paracoccaceae bacterium]